MSAAGRWTRLRDVSRRQLEVRPDSEVVPDVAYERVENVDRISTPDGHFFFEGDEPRVVYVSVDGADPAGPLIEELGAGETMRSRSEKRSMLHVWAELGLAASVDEDGRLEFVEVCPQMTLAEYRRRMYVEPEPHLR